MTNEQNQNQGLLDSYDANQLAAPSRAALVVYKFPGEGEALVCKLIPDLLDPQRAQNRRLNPYWEVTEHQHCVGMTRDGQPILRSHVCQKTLGSKNCPECDRYYELLDQIKLAGEGTPEGKKLKYLSGLYNPKKKGWVYFIARDSNVIKAIKLGKDVLNKLWGKPKSKYREEVKSLIEEMKMGGMNPFDLKQPGGWLEMFKTGVGLGTVYTVRVAGKEEVKYTNGRPTGKEFKYIECDIPASLLSQYNIDDLPDFRKLEFANSFTAAESIEFAKTGATPERVLAEYNANTTAASVDGEEAGDQPATPEAGLANLGSAIGTAAPKTVGGTLDDVDAAL